MKKFLPVFSDNLLMNKKLFFFAFFMAILVSPVFSEVYRQNAIVSYYAEAFHGKKTSNGETYNMNAMTCASKELPFNTKVRVTNLANGKQVVLRVNDRGPFVPDRELDLSKAAAVKLDMIKSGTAHVKIEIIEWGPKTKASVQTAEKAKKIMAQRFPGWKPSGGTSSAEVKKTVPKNIAPGKMWDIQLGAFSTRENANVLAQQLLKEGFKNVVFQKGNGIYRVVIREVPSKDLEKTLKQLEDKGHESYSVRERK